MSDQNHKIPSGQDFSRFQSLSAAYLRGGAELIILTLVLDGALFYQTGNHKEMRGIDDFDTVWTQNVKSQKKMPLKLCLMHEHCWISR